MSFRNLTLSEFEDTWEDSYWKLFFDETTLFMGQPLENVYARSKFEAEKAVLDAMLEGLEANIIRVGNLTNRVSDAKFQKNHESNAFLNSLGRT